MTNIFKSVALLSILALPAHYAQAYDTLSDASNGSSAQATDSIIALANDTPILKSELEAMVATVSARLKASNQPVLPPEQLKQEVLNNLILRKLQLELTQRAGIRAEQTAVNQRLAQIAQSQGLTSLSQLQQQLDAQQPNAYATLRQQIMEEEAINLLRQSQISNRVRITDRDIDAFLASPEANRLQQSKYHTIHLRIPFATAYERLTDAQKAQTYQVAKRAQQLLTTTNDADAVVNTLNKETNLKIQGGDMGVHDASELSTDIANKLLLLKAGEVGEPQLTPTGIDIVKLIDKQQSDSVIIPQWKVRHILVESDELYNEDLAKQKIEDIYVQLQNDADFNSLAATFSDDPGSAGRGGDLGWVPEGKMVPTFEEMMKRTPVGDFSTPFESQFGWHILKVEDQRNQDVSETVRRNLARQALFQRLASQAQEDWLQELRANAYIKIYDL